MYPSVLPKAYRATTSAPSWLWFGSRVRIIGCLLMATYMLGYVPQWLRHRADDIRGRHKCYYRHRLEIPNTCLLPDAVMRCAVENYVGFVPFLIKHETRDFGAALGGRQSSRHPSLQATSTHWGVVWSKVFLITMY